MGSFKMFRHELMDSPAESPPPVARRYLFTSIFFCQVQPTLCAWDLPDVIIWQKTGGLLDLVLIN